MNIITVAFISLNFASLSLEYNFTSFICDDGKAINFQKICDGTKDCQDGSDEIRKKCYRTICPINTFRCYYGACIPDGLVCDGVQDCADGSDESRCGQRTDNCENDEHQCSTTSECIPLKTLCDGKIDCGDGSDEGDICQQAAACPSDTYRCRVGGCVYLKQVCDDRKDCLDGSDESPVLCSSKQKSQEIRCPPITAERMNVYCEVPLGSDKGRTDCNIPLPPGTMVHYECKPYYMPASSSHTYNVEMTCQSDGTWNKEQLRCIPECGIAEYDAVPLIVHGWTPERGRYSWHAVLYTLDGGEWVFTCGGTLITEKVVITAAHCTWNIDATTIQVALGKHYSDYNKQEDYTQIRNVSTVIHQPLYQDLLGNYGSDIAVLVLSSSVEFSPLIRPACVDWNLNDISEHLTKNKLGLIVGMGLTEKNTFSKKLRATYLPVIKETECISKQSRDFKKYITFTSFCAGWQNGTGVCNGDSGGGLLFPSVADPNKFTIQGIVSVSPRQRGTSHCDPNYYTVFTKVGMYVQWIYEKLKEIHEDVKYDETISDNVIL